MFNPFAKPLDTESQHPPMAELDRHEGTPPAPHTQNPADFEAGMAPKRDPHASKTTPHAGSAQQNTPSRGPVSSGGGAPSDEKLSEGGTHFESPEAMGGGVSEGQMTMGAWLTEPPFAAELRARYGQMVEQARLRAGGRKVHHQQPRRGQPEPTYDVVGGTLSDEDLHQIDLAYLGLLYAKGDECFRAGQLREARWVRDTYRARQAEMAAPLLAELRTLRDRWLKAEVRALQGWDTPEQEEGAYQAMRKIATRIGELADRLEQFAPHLIPSPLFPLPNEVTP